MDYRTYHAINQFVHHQRIGPRALDDADQLGRAAGGRDAEAFLAEAARHERAELGVILEHDHMGIHHHVVSIARDLTSA